jgi:hypothetical protein
MAQTLIDLDIQQGDILAVDGREYPIRSIRTYESTGFRGSSFRRLATKQAQICREVSNGSGSYDKKIVVDAIRCTPLDSVSYENQRREALETPVRLLQTFIKSANGYYIILIEDLGNE